MRPVTVEKRFAACLLDAIIFVPLGLLAVDLVRQWVFGVTGRPNFRFTGIAGPVRPEDSFGLGMAAALLLYSASEIFAGASVGKRLFGLRIGQREGTRAGRQRLLFRWLIKYSPAIFYLALYGTEWILFRTTGYVLGEQSRLMWHLARFVLTGIILAYGVALMASILLVSLPPRRAIHDLLTGTAVFEHDLRQPRGGFEAVVADNSRRTPS